MVFDLLEVLALEEAVREAAEEHLDHLLDALVAAAAAPFAPAGAARTHGARGRHSRWGRWTWKSLGTHHGSAVPRVALEGGISGRGLLLPVPDDDDS